MIAEFQNSVVSRADEAAALTAYFERVEPMIDLGADRWLRKQFTRRLFGWRPWYNWLATTKSFTRRADAPSGARRQAA